ncbi:hypothetical protein GEMRC1_004786 [Eukaryota sp. GEM-RC1]
MLEPLDQLTPQLQSQGQFQWEPIPARSPVPLKDVSLPEVFSFEPSAPGIFPPNFDVQSYESLRQSADASQFVPGPFSQNLPNPPPIDSLPDEAKVTSIRDVVHSSRTAQVRLVVLSDLKLSPKEADHLLRSMSSFPNLNYLFLRNCNIKSISSLSSQTLRYLDLSDNPLSKVNASSFTRACPFIQHLVLPTSLKSSSVSQLIGNFRFLISLNNQPLAPQDRCSAVMKHGPAPYKQQLPLLLWDLVVSLQPQVQSLTTWLPFHVREINAPNSLLTSFHVAEFKALEKLILPGNQLTTLSNFGLESLERLYHIDVSKNKLSRLDDDFKVLYCVPSLLDVIVTGNNYPNGYRPLLMTRCRCLKGISAQPGLRSIDGEMISVNELVTSCFDLGLMSKDQADDYRWSLVCIKNFGHETLFSDQASDIVRRVKNGKFDYAGLTRVDLSLFPNLELLSLKGNSLVSCDLTVVKKLKFLDLTNNSTLDLELVLSQLDNLGSLVHLNILTDFDPNQSNLITFRIQLLARLFFSCPKLNVMDDHQIQVSERLNALQLLKDQNMVKNLKFNPSEYLFFHSIIESLRLDDVSWTPAAIVPGQQYNNLNVKELRLPHLNNFEFFDSSVLRFDWFENLEKLDVSFCNISSVVGLKIQKLSKLSVFDCRQNLINHDEMSSTSEIIDKLPKFKLFYC